MADFQEKVIQPKTRVLIFFKTFPRNISF